MTDITRETGIKLNFTNENEIIEAVINKACDYVKCPYETMVEVVLTDNTGIKEINKAQRNIDTPTDVLSFPMLSYEYPCCFDGIDDDESLFDLESGYLVLGDIVISLDKVISQAKEYGHSQKRELAFLVAHSMMHLFGYDHMTDNEAKIMEEKQNEILKELNITRDDGMDK